MDGPITMYVVCRSVLASSGSFRRVEIPLGGGRLGNSTSSLEGSKHNGGGYTFEGEEVIVASAAETRPRPLHRSLPYA
jgi:hypothetical protein